MKNDIFLKLDIKVAAHSEVVQNTSKTPKLSISDHISSLKLKIRDFPFFLAILRISYEREKCFWDEFLVRTHT